MDTAPSPDVAEDAARRVLNARIAAVRELAKMRAEVVRAREAVTAAEHADASAYAAATRAGWTENELKEIGFPAPQRRAPGRPRRPRRSPDGNSDAATDARAGAPDHGG